MHTRHAPQYHSFKYHTHMLYLDLDELGQLANDIGVFSINRFNLIAFHRCDYLQDYHQDLKTDIIETVARDSLGVGVTTEREITRVCLLTQPRYFGVSFNPLSLFYCYDVNNQLICVVGEVHNTPWNQRHRYVIPCLSTKEWQYKHEKDFHVSPFNPMNLNYHWTLSHADQHLKVVIDARVRHQEEARHFVAAMRLSRTSVNRMPSLLIRYPMSAVTTIIRIYSQALKLWLKKVPFYSHPETK
ncbi:hypothetical protein DFR27_0402 [Umboniibacter marinipuniceus]|uniref:DUF1365 family protein n=1 Tax=Umboniibacter marinipuniceus TaxID=569599 RepID=A0A3M0ABA3_9GAMM|nr:hypothetical protein DFR27_0402 [Umboniibacter marinipuniceus]